MHSNLTLLNFEGDSTFFSESFDEIQAVIGTTIIPHNLNVRADWRTFYAHHTSVELGEISLHRLYYSNPADIEPVCDGKTFISQTLLEGECEVTRSGESVRMRQGQTTINSPYEKTRIRSAGATCCLITCIKYDLLEKYLSDTLERIIQRPLDFELGVACDKAVDIRWLQTLNYIIQQCELNSVHSSSRHVLRQHQGLLLSSMLSLYNNNYKHALENLSRNTIIPGHVKKARDYMNACLGKKISLTELENHTGVTARTLQNGFKNNFGVSPLEYLWELRLKRVHSYLNDNKRAGSLKLILQECGVHNTSRFAKLYKKRYGQTPSKTYKYGCD